MKEIALRGKYGKGRFALVDDEDFELANRYKWFSDKKGYVKTSIFLPDGRQKTCRMHRLILGLTDSTRFVDHINHICYDNRRCNLRVCTNQQNTRNARKKVGTSQYKGVYWYPRSKKWRAKFGINNLQKHIGTFDSELTAAKHYDFFSNYFFREFACNNNLDLTDFKPTKGLHLLSDY